MTSVTSKQIIELAAPSLTLQLGSQINVSVSEVMPAHLARATSLVFISEKKQLEEALEKKARIFIVKDSVWNEVKERLHSEIVLWSTPHIQMAMGQVLPLFDLKTQFLKPGIHPMASIHPQALIDPTAHVGPHCTVEAYATIGAGAILHASVYVGSYCQVGARSIIGPFTSIGSDGFGFFTDKQFKHHKIPQVGRAIVEDDCELGAHCAVDRAALTETRVRKGTKLDNFCHIGHNVEIGENAIAAGGFMVAGSTRIGRNFMAAGAVAITGHLEITDGVVIAGRAAVTSDIKEPGVYGGFPLEPQRENLKTLATLPQIKTFRKQINKILKHLNLDRD